MGEPTAKAFIQIEKATLGRLRHYLNTRFVLSGMRAGPNTPVAVF